MFRRAKRLIFVPFIAVMLVGATTVAHVTVRSFVPFGGASTKTSAEEPLASTTSVEESSASSEEETRIWQLLLGRPLTEAEAAERRHQFSNRLHVVRNRLTDEDKRTIARLDKVQQMPRTDYPDFRPIPADDEKWSGVWSVHRWTEIQFTLASGFGVLRMVQRNDELVADTSHITVKRVEIPLDRVELVSLLTSSEPNAYVIDTIATPRIAKVAKRRSLDAFESAALGALQRGENLVYSPVDPTRMFGAIRADGRCIHCHKGKRDGDLLGAFTYWLKQPADEIKPW